MKIIVGMPNHSIEDPFVIDKILSHLEGRGSLRVSDSSPWSTRAAASGLLATSRATDGRSILHKEEASRAMSARWRLIRCQMCDGVG